MFALCVGCACDVSAAENTHVQLATRFYCVAVVAVVPVVVVVVIGVVVVVVVVGTVVVIVDDCAGKW